MSDRLTFVLGMMMSTIFALGAALMVREYRRSGHESQRRAARRSLYAKPRVIDFDLTDIDPKKSNNYG